MESLVPVTLLIVHSGWGTALKGSLQYGHGLSPDRENLCACSKVPFREVSSANEGKEPVEGMPGKDLCAHYITFEI